MKGEDFDKFCLEKEYEGVHEFKPEYRGSCYTEPFGGVHPKSVQENLDTLKSRIKSEIKDE